MDAQTLIVIAIVGLAVLYVGRKIFRKKPPGSGGCGCGSEGGCCGQIADKPHGACGCDRKS